MPVSSGNLHFPLAELRPHLVYVACAIMAHIRPYTYIHRTSSNLYSPDSVSLASLANNALLWSLDLARVDRETIDTEASQEEVAHILYSSLSSSTQFAKQEKKRRKKRNNILAVTVLGW